MYKAPKSATSTIGTHKLSELNLTDKARLAAASRQTELNNFLLKAVFEGNEPNVRGALTGAIDSPTKEAAARKLQEAEAAIVAVFETEGNSEAASDKAAKDYTQARLHLEAAEQVKADANTQMSLYRGSALYHAVRLGRLGIARLLLEHGAEVHPDTPSPVGSYHRVPDPLLAAAKNGDIEMLKLLLAFGANPFYDSHFTTRLDRKVVGWNALHVAAHHGHHQFAGMIIRAMIEQVLKNIAITARLFADSIRKAIEEISKHGPQVELNLFKINCRMLLDQASVNILWQNSAPANLSQLGKTAVEVIEKQLGRHIATAQEEIQTAATLLGEAERLVLRELEAQEIGFNFGRMQCHQNIFAAFKNYQAAQAKARVLVATPDKFVADEILNCLTFEDHNPLSLAVERACPHTLALLSPRPQAEVPAAPDQSAEAAPRRSTSLPNLAIGDEHTRVQGIMLATSPAGRTTTPPSHKATGEAEASAQSDQAATGAAP